MENYHDTTDTTTRNECADKVGAQSSSGVVSVVSLW